MEKAVGDTPEPSSRSKQSATPSLPAYVASSTGGHEGFDQADFHLEDQTLPLAPRSDDDMTEYSSEVSDDVVEGQVMTSSSSSSSNVMAWMRGTMDAENEQHSEQQEGNGDYVDQQYGNDGYQEQYPGEEGYGDGDDHGYYDGGEGGGDAGDTGNNGPPPPGDPSGDPPDDDDDGGGGGGGGGPADDDQDEEQEDDEHNKEDNYENEQKNPNEHHQPADVGTEIQMDPQIAYSRHEEMPVEYAGYDSAHDHQAYQYHEGMHEGMSLPGNLEEHMDHLDHLEYLQQQAEEERNMTHEQRLHHREERRRMKEEAERTKKRRKKWVLPLDEESIESERRRKVRILCHLFVAKWITYLYYLWLEEGADLEDGDAATRCSEARGTRSR